MRMSVALVEYQEENCGGQKWVWCKQQEARVRAAKLIVLFV